MGLFDMDGGQMNPELLQLGLGLLAGSGPSRTPQSFGSIFGQAGQQALQAGAQYRQQQGQDELRKLQVRQQQMQLAEAERAQDEARRLQAAYASLGGGAGTPAVPNGGQQIQLPTSGGGSDVFRTGAPAAPSAPSTPASLYDKAMQNADAFARLGFGKQAKEYYDLAEKAKEEYDTKLQQGKDEGGALSNYLVSKLGKVKKVDIGVKPDIQEIKLGNRIQLQDFNTVTPGQSFTIGQSPDSAASVAATLRGQNMTDARAKEKFNLDQFTPQYMETTGGIVALPKKLQAGETPRGILATDAQGKPLEKKKDIPQYVVEGVIDNAKSLKVIDSALKGMGTPAGRGAVGYKGYLPPDLLNRVDPEGALTRADIGDFGSLTIKDRSGAAVTASETARYKPFVPLITDDSDAVVKKLTRFKQLIEEDTNNLTFAYPGAKKLADYSSPPSGDDAKTMSLADIADTARATGKTTAEVTAAARAKGFKIGGN